LDRLWKACGLGLALVLSLTVSEVPRFCERSGIINLRIVDASIRFEINAALGERAILRFSAKVLAVGRIIGEVRP
jgi:hypothetical protein